MELPLIKKNKNQFLFIHKNYKNINRYQSMFNKFKLDIPKKPKNFKSDLFGSNVFEEIKKNNKFSNSTRNNNLNYKIDGKNKMNIINFNQINNNLNTNYFSFLSPIKNKILNKSNNIAFYKNNNSPAISFYNSSNINSSSIENIKLNSNNSNKTSQNILVYNQKNITKITKIDKILTKFKLIKILEKNSQHRCYIQEIKNDLFYKKHKDKLFNDKFIKYQVNQHRHFIFDKNESPIKKLNNYLINIDNLNNKKDNLSAENIFKSLNKKDINIIKSDMSYFKDIYGNLINDLIKIKSKSKSLKLLDILNKSEQKEENIFFNNNEKKEEKRPIIYNENKKILTNYERYVNKIINNDLNQRLHKINIMNKKKDINKIIKEFTSKININIAKLNSPKDKELENYCFRTFFNQLDEDMKKKYSIERNRQRLLDEKDFHYKKLQKYKSEFYEKEVIEDYTNKIKKINEK